MAEPRNQRFSWKIFFIFLSAGSWLSHVSPFLPSATSTCLQLGESKLTERWSYCRSMGQQTHFEHTKRGPEAKLTAEWDHYLFLPLFTFNFPPWSTHAVFGFLNSLWYQKWKRQKRKGTACQHSSRKAGSTNRMSMCALYNLVRNWNSFNWIFSKKKIFYVTANHKNNVLNITCQVSEHCFAHIRQYGAD